MYICITHTCRCMQNYVKGQFQFTCNEGCTLYFFNHLVLFTIQVMVLQLAHHVQTCLHKHNKPQLSFYDKMMANKRKEEERILAAEQQKLQKEIEANKEREEDEVRKDIKMDFYCTLGCACIVVLSP